MPSLVYFTAKRQGSSFFLEKKKEAKKNQEHASRAKGDAALVRCGGFLYATQRCVGRRSAIKPLDGLLDPVGRSRIRFSV
jgi:hypothetical protein